MRALFPVLIEAAATLGVDDEVVDAAKAALPHLPELPMQLPGVPKLVAKDDGQAVIASSYMPGSIVHNSENLGLEPVWPYGLIGDSGPMHALAVRTFQNRPNKAEADWSFDPVQAARLGLGLELKSTLEKITEHYQVYPNGLAQLTDAPEFYVEQTGVVADALQKGLAEDYDGLLRIKPAWPAGWNADGTVVIQHGDRVDVQVRDGKVVTLGIEAKHSGELRLRNPMDGPHGTRDARAECSPDIDAGRAGCAAAEGRGRGIVSAGTRRLEERGAAIRCRFRNTGERAQNPWNPGRLDW